MVPRGCPVVSRRSSLFPDERVERAAHMALAGFRAIKLRIPQGAGWREALALATRVREALGPDVELMLDANQGWRMPGDGTRPWDAATASLCARARGFPARDWLPCRE